MRPAPSFTLPDANGNPTSLEKWKGKYVLIYFYPRALTPGCTQQACDLESGLATLNAYGVHVVGISPDTPQRLQTFTEKNNLSFTLLSDADHRISEAYGAWGEKTNYGKTSLGVKRCSFIITPEGSILHAWHNVKAKTHFQVVLNWIQLNLSDKLCCNNNASM